MGISDYGHIIKCKDCKFWYNDTTTHLGECHRHAPSPQIVDMFPNSNAKENNAVSWPETHEDEWCGEFQEAKIYPLWRRWFE